MEGQKQHFAVQSEVHQPVEDDDSGYVTRRFIIDPSRSAAPIMLPDPPPQSPTPTVPPAPPSHPATLIPQEKRTPLLDPFRPEEPAVVPPPALPVPSLPPNRAVQARSVPPQTLRRVSPQAAQAYRSQQQIQSIQRATAQAVMQQQAQLQQAQQQVQRMIQQAQAATSAPPQRQGQGQTTSSPAVEPLKPASHMGLQSHQHALNMQQQVNQSAPQQPAPQMQPQAALPPATPAVLPAAPPPAQPAQQVPPAQPAAPQTVAPTSSPVVPPTPTAAQHTSSFAPAVPPTPPTPQHTSSFVPIAAPAPQHTSSFAPVTPPVSATPQHTSSFAPVAPPTQTAAQHTSSFAPVAAPTPQHTSSFAPVTPPVPPPVMVAQTHALAPTQPPQAPVLAQQPYSQHFLHSVQTLPQKQEGSQQIQHIPQPQLQIAVTAYSKYKLPVIPGTAPRTTLPLGVGLVLEGGGTRGFYSAGVFEAFMDAGIMFPYIAAVSAGAANVLSYVSGQRGRNRLIVERLVSDPRYLSGSNLIKDRSLFNFDFIFKTIPEEYLFWDQHMFDRVQTRLLTGAIDCREGRTIWFEKSQLEPDFMPVIASCSIPLLSKIVRFDNRDLLDGGILDPIPIEKSIADGNNFHVVVLTQNADYIKQPSKIGPLLKMTYKKYPHLIWAIKERHEAYNRQVALAERLEREGRALIIRPHNNIEISRIESDPEKLLDLHDEGHLDGALAVDKLHQIFKFKM